MPDIGRMLFLLMLVLLIALVVTAKQSRRDSALTARKQCRQCGARYGSEAQYCGRCGRAF